MNLSKISADERKKRAEFVCVHYHNGFSHQNCYNKKNKLQVEEKIGFLDIETTGLKADYAYILTYCIKTQNGKLYKSTITKDDILSGRYDKRLLKQLNKDIRRFDRVITQYGTRFDIPFIRSRCLYWGLSFPIFKEVKHTDIYFIAKAKLVLSSRRLGTICSFLGIPAKNHPIKPSIWFKCQYGNKNAINYVLTHNIEDVISLQRAWNKLHKYVGRNNTSM